MITRVSNSTRTCHRTFRHIDTSDTKLLSKLLFYVRPIPRVKDECVFMLYKRNSVIHCDVKDTNNTVYCWTQIQLYNMLFIGLLTIHWIVHNGILALKNTRMKNIERTYEVGWKYWYKSVIAVKLCKSIPFPKNWNYVGVFIFWLCSIVVLTLGPRRVDWLIV